MRWFIQVLRDYPELALFFTLAVGYAVGKIKIGSFTVGSVTGVLIIGVLVGQLDIQINGTVKAVFFLLFLFALGYNVGPQFFKGLKKDGVSQVIFSMIVCGAGLISVMIAGKILHYNVGQAAGLTAGALTQSSVIGVGQGAIAGLNISHADKVTMSDFVPVGYAITYIFGTIGTSFFLSTIAPKILGINLEEEAKKLDQRQMTVEKGADSYFGTHTVEYRSFKLARNLVGKKVSEVERTVSVPKSHTFIIVR